MLNAVKSRESADHEMEQGDNNPTRRAGFGLLVVAHQAAVLHQPAKGAFDHPTFGKHMEADQVIAAPDGFHCQTGTSGFHPCGEALAAVAAIDPQRAQSREVRQRRRKGRRHGGTEHPAQRVHQQETFATLGFLVRIVARFATVRVGAHVLTVEHGGRGAGPFADGFVNQGAELGVEPGQQPATTPVPKVATNCFPRREGVRQEPPRTPRFEQVENGGPDRAQVGAGTPALLGLGRVRFEERPLGVGQVSFVRGDFYRLNGGAAKMSRKTGHPKSSAHCNFTRPFSPPAKFIFSDKLF